MTNAVHAGKLAEVWKHGVLTTVLDREPTTRYAETHAGSATYPLSHDAEREFGVWRFLAAADEVLAGSRYRAELAPYAERGRVPGSAVLATNILGDSAAYLLCDLDPMSVADLRAATAGLSDCEVAARDGMRATAEWLATGDTATVHVDPFDPHAGDPSALDLAGQVAENGHRLVYWYGYDRPDERAWAYQEIRRRTGVPLWCGDVFVVDAQGRGRPGDLGEGTTAGTGVGTVLANVDPATITACESFGTALAAAYADATLPDGSRGHLEFTVRA